MNQSVSIQDLVLDLRDFAEERDWEQFHSPKNLAAALSVEAAELLEHFQWLTEENSRALSSEQLEAVGQEIADVQLYLLRLADQLNIDILEQSQKKMVLNRQKYPAEQSRGSSRKYTAYEQT